MSQRENYIRGLHAELRNLERKGEEGRAALVRQELAKYEEAPAAAPVETAAPAGPISRTRKAGK